jgi:Glycosyl transferases group 1
VTRVLFLTPAVPAPARNGLAMRAAVAVDGLRRHHDLSVAVVRSPFDTTPLDWVRAQVSAVVDLRYGDGRQDARSWMETERARRVARSPLPALARYWPPAVGRQLVDLTGSDFDVVFVMGAHTAGAAVPLLESGAVGVLDAYDDDAKTSASLATLDPSYADEVPRYQAFQREVFSWFVAVLFASLDDAVAPYLHLPNAVTIPPPRGPRASGGPVEVLFVGNPAYLPNRDALDRLRHSILPAIEATGTPARLLHPGPTDDVAPFYERAHVAAVPLRAGGGTPIKVLEAFAHGCPVVATPTGARGLGVASGEHLVVTADDHDDLGLARAVVELARDDDRRTKLAEAARAFVVAHHDAIEVGDMIARLVARHGAAGAGRRA